MTAPLKEKFSNLAQDTLNGSHNNSTTSIVLNDASEFPSAGNFRIRCDDEIMIATARSSNTLTVVRGAEGTSAASHSSGTTVAHIITADGIERWARDGVPLFGSSAPPLNLLTAHDGVTVLDSSNFAWVNQGSASLTDHNGSLTLRTPNNNGHAWRIAKRSAPSPPYVLTVALQMFVPRDIDDNAGNVQVSLIARQSTSGKFYSFGLNTIQTSQSQRFAVDKWSSATSFSSTPLKLHNSVFIGSMLWLKFEDDNTNLKFSVGYDGIEFVQLLSEARGTFLTLSGGVTGPDELGIGLNANTTFSSDSIMRLLSWSTT